MDSHRERLRHLHLARRCRRLLQESGWSQAELARRIGRSKQRVSEMLGVLACPDLVAAFDRDGMESGVVRALLPLLPGERRALLAELREHHAREGRFPPVREVAEWVRQRRGAAPLPKAGVEHLELVRDGYLSHGLPVKLKLVRRKQAGFTVEVAVTESEAEWLCAALGGGAAATRHAA